ncbi:conserved exported hypothetical protein [Paraburkholderia ribeironis]|uniref:DUF2844 domain-containing protein n=1 Tax=Paraburkholderia ribeironis TaxID=1247936 RepID=A0A1N7SGS4_9BURK|nr:DUF2844 domain-containing protein [Paraburkholderia ribeironis]SIT46526.1 conserved exported hypothetical protein [Paraburkholderia ribeironis]
MKLMKLALAVAALSPVAASATLGGAPAMRMHAIAGSRSLLQAATPPDVSAAAASYTVREATDADGVTIREYVLPSNVVFAVTWQGPVRPDMSALLGSYFPNFADPGNGRTRGIGPMVQHNGDFHIESAGHAGYFFGKAYLPRVVPTHVRMEDLQ